VYRCDPPCLAPNHEGLFTHAVKYNMLEIRPPALCADRVRAPLRWHSHSWLCSIQSAIAVMPDRVTTPEAASLRTPDPRHRRARIATYLESYSCTNTSTTSVESYSCKKSGGAPPPTAIQLSAARVPHPSVSRVRFFPARPRRGVSLARRLLRAASFWQIGFASRFFAAIPGSLLDRIRAHGAGSSSPLECALTQKQGWGVPPPAGFSQ
jgi:hypothetical protein